MTDSGISQNESRELLLRCICVPDDMGLCERLTSEGLLVFCGNQHNPEWQWKAGVLESLETDELYELWKAQK